jgi:amino acid adenylation domain-containing protein
MTDTTESLVSSPGSGAPAGRRDCAAEPPASLAQEQPPASLAQEQLWFIDEFHHGLPAHNVPNLVRLRGPLDVTALRRALGGLVARHEPLRTRLAAGPAGHPRQLIDPPAPVELPLADHTALARPDAEARLREFASAEALRPFHLAGDHPFRAHLARLAADEHALLLVSHRTAFDEWSLPVLLAELAALYEAEVTGTAPALPELPAPFASHAMAERELLQGEVLAGLEDYWRTALAGFESSQFPSDRPRPVLADHNGEVVTRLIEQELLNELRVVSRRHDTTLEVTLLAALTVLLYRYTGHADVMLGATIPARGRPGLEPLIGFLANTLPVRADLSGDPPFAELLASLGETVQAGRDHADLPFARIVDALDLPRDAGRFPVYQTVFCYCEPPARREAAGVTFRAEPVGLRASMYDIGFRLLPASDGLRIEATYTPALFDRGTVGRLLGHWEVVLRGVVADAGVRVSGLPLLTEPELRAELVEWNATAADLPVTCIHEGFEEQAARAPRAVAVEFEDQRVSYGELNRWANQVARRLRELGVGPETLAGVCMGTSLRRLAVLLGVWKAGGGYVPLDPAAPAERLAFMAADTGMTVVVTDEASGERLGAAGPTVVSIDAEWERISRLDGHDLAGTGVSPSNVAYVIYTSGSTGQPKGVVVEHRHAINFLQGMVKAWHIRPDSAVLGFAAFTFDVSVMDMFMPLLGGARLVLASPETLHSPPRLAALMREAGVTFACLPPAVLRLLIGEDFPGLRTLLSAGEELSSDLLRAWQRDGLDIYNGYGPTEAAIGATFMKLEPGTPLPPPIGRPKPNYQAYVLDAHLNPVPVGIVGELHIGGAGVTRGYLNRPELTRERFIPDPFAGLPGARLYKTGDLVRRRPDGTLVFAGRADNQVKIRGLRVELGEIEAALAAHAGVAQAVVAVVTDQAGEKQLAGYLRPQPGATVTVADLRAHLSASLPAYMVPTYLTTVGQFPLTPHGKIDKTALPAPQAQTASTRAQRVPARTLLEIILVDVYARLLRDEHVGAADSFFDLGGNSLQAMQLVTELRNALAVNLDVAAIFLTPTPQQLAALLRDKHGFTDEDLDEEAIDAC